MTLDLVTSQRLVEPTPWEMERYRAAQKNERADWHDVLDRASAYRWDDAVLRVVESEDRREERARRLWFMPAVAMCGGPRPNVFRALFQKDIGGVSGVSDSWFDASYYVLDGVSGKVSDFVDYIDPTHTLRQATSARQASTPAADALFSGALTCVMSSTMAYQSTRAASAWRYFHDGTGVNSFCVMSPNSNAISVNTLLNTRSGGIGFTHYRGNTSTHAVFLTGGPSFASGTSLPLNVATYTEWRYQEGLSPEYNALTKSASVSSGSVASPSPADPEIPLQIGSVGAFTTNFNVRGEYAFRRVLSAAHRTIVQQWIQRETGLAP